MTPSSPLTTAGGPIEGDAGSISATESSVPSAQTAQIDPSAPATTLIATAEGTSIIPLVATTESVVAVVALEVVVEGGSVAGNCEQAANTADSAVSAEVLEVKKRRVIL